MLSPPLINPILTGILGGLAGWAIGATAGLAAEEGCSADFCQVEGVFYGGAAGGSIGLALGAHLGNGRGGNLPVTLLASAATWAAGIGIFHALEDEEAQLATLLAIPVVQIGVTVAAERWMGTRGDRSEGLALALIPRRDGVGLGIMRRF